jgi:hypothetical protein
MAGRGKVPLTADKLFRDSNCKKDHWPVVSSTFSDIEVIQGDELFWSQNRYWEVDTSHTRLK